MLRRYAAIVFYRCHACRRRHDSHADARSLRCCAEVFSAQLLIAADAATRRCCHDCRFCRLLMPRVFMLRHAICYAMLPCLFVAMMMPLPPRACFTL